MGGPIPTESNINMTGAGLVGKSTSGTGKSGRMSQASVLSWLGLSASGVTDGKALIASSNSIAWSPSAAALLPDTLPAVGTLLSYGGSRQLAAGGTVSHSGALTLGGAITVTTPVTMSLGPSSLNSGNPGLNAASGTLYLGSANNSTWLCAGNTERWNITSSGHLAANGALNITTTGAVTASTVNIDDGSAFGILNLTTTAGRTGQIKHNGTLVAQLTAYSSDVTIYKPTTFTGLLTVDGALTCGAITASGAVNVTPKVEVIYSGTTPATPAYGSIALVGTTFSDGPYTGGGLCSHRLQGLWFPDGVPVMGTRTTLAVGATFTTWLSFGSTTGVGGKTSSFPGFNASGTTFRIRLADNSADAPLSAGAITASGAVMETPTQSAINPTTVNIPAGQRRGWYNSTLAEFRDWVNIGGTLLKSAAYT